MDILAELETTKAALEKANGELASLTASKDEAAAELEKSQGALAALIESSNTSAEASQVEISRLTAAQTLATAEIEKLKAEAKSVDQKVLEITGKKGGAPAESIHAADDNKKELAKADFDKLTPHAKKAFCLAGGQLV